VAWACLVHHGGGWLGEYGVLHVFLDLVNIVVKQCLIITFKVILLCLQFWFKVCNIDQNP
jgi:hypothetical protein